MALNFLLRNLFKNSLTLLSGNFFAYILNFISLAIIARSIDISSFGYFSLFVVYWEIFYRIFNPQSFEMFIQQANKFKSKNQFDSISMLLKFLLLVDFIVIPFGFIFSLIFSRIFIISFDIPLEHVLSLKILCFCILAYLFSNISIAIFRFYNKFNIQALNTFFLAAIKLLLFSLVSFKNPSLYNFAQAFLLSHIINAIMTLFLINYVLTLNKLSLIEIFKSKINFQLIKKLKIIYSIIYQSFNTTIKTVPRQIDIVLLGSFSTPESIALFKIGKDLSNILIKIFDSFYQAMYPEISKLFINNEYSLAKKYILGISGFLFLSSIFCYLVFYLFGLNIIELIFTTKYLGAYEIMLIFLVGVVLQVSTLPMAPILYSKGYFKESLINTVFASLISLVIMIILIQKLDVIGAAVSFVIFYIIWIAFTVLTIKSKRIF